MATRQRGRSSTAKPSAPVSSSTSSAGNLSARTASPTSTPSVDLSRTAADVPGITATDGLTATDGSTNLLDDSTAKVRFVGEQLIYQSRDERIAESAYAYAQARGFAPGHEVEDWLRAEKEVDALLAGAGFATD